jgi:hypothetical protein
MAYTFRGMDPNARLSGTQAWSNLQASGAPLTDAHKQQAMGFLNYTDPSGNAEIGGNDWNRLSEEAAKMFGGTFQAWQPPPPANTGPVTPYAEPAKAPDSPLGLPEPFTASPYQAPTGAQLQAHPGYGFIRDEGLDAIKAQHAATGDLFTGGTMKELADWATANAARHYGDVVNRDLQIGEFNRGGDRDVYDRGVDRAVLTDARDFRNREYESGEARWAQEFNQRVNEFASSDQFRRYVYGNDDEYRRWRDSVGDAWKREVADEQRRQFLAELGAR